MNRDYLHADLPATVIKDSVSDAMIGQKEEASDSNPWENVHHNDRWCLETTAAAPSPIGAPETHIWGAATSFFLTHTHLNLLGNFRY